MIACWSQRWGGTGKGASSRPWAHCKEVSQPCSQSRVFPYTCSQAEMGPQAAGPEAGSLHSRVTSSNEGWALYWACGEQ